MRQLLIKKLEGPQRPARRYVLEIWVGGLENVHAAGPTGDGDVLLSVMLPCDGLSDDSRRSLELPHDLAGLAVDGDELARQLAGEHEPPGGHERAGPVRALEW